jgi:hypothetical protein
MAGSSGSIAISPRAGLLPRWKRVTSAPGRTLTLLVQPAAASAARPMIAMRLYPFVM